MKARFATFLGLCAVIFISVGCSESPVRYSAGRLEITVNSRGFVTGLVDNTGTRDYCPEDVISPLLSIGKDGVIVEPLSMTANDGGDLVTLSFPDGVSADIRVAERAEYITFDLVSLSADYVPDFILWGPYAATIGETIGETVGVVRNDAFAIGIQVLNPKTLGGYPNEASDVMPSYNIFAGSDYSDIDDTHADKELFRGDTAKPAEFGSTLQAYCRDRSRNRIIANWGHKRYSAPAFDDGGVIGSKIALFGSAPDEALATIGKIEVTEGLPHPLLDGEWVKTARGASAAYLIMPFGEADIDRAVAITQKAGLRYLYHPDPFATWGHFTLKPDRFPNGMESMTRCVEYAGKAGIRVGVHTLSNFITTSDPYVTPLPDPRLARVGSSTLAEAVDDVATEIFIADPGFFNQMENNNLRTVMIGSELVRYGGVSGEAPWKLFDCERGAFGTTATAHDAGDDIGKLIDHGYKVFLTDADLMFEVADTLAELFNTTGLRQISFDGLEGCWSTGMGQYGRTLFTKRWHDGLSDDIKSAYIADASNPGHYFWHMYTRMNWGEPWYAGFRESQTQYRLKNQNFFRRNLMPAMLGWFSLRRETSIEDIEWLLARSAGFDAGYSLFTDYGVIDDHGMSDEILTAVGRWEAARMAGAFSEDQKARLRDIGREFTLEGGDGSWRLIPVHVDRLRHENKIRQPGEPLYSTATIDNPYGDKSPEIIITAKDSGISDIVMEFNNHRTVNIPLSLEETDVLKIIGNEAVLYDAQWHVKRRVTLKQEFPVLNKGGNTVTFDCSFSERENGSAGMEMRIAGEAEMAGQ